MRVQKCGRFELAKESSVMKFVISQVGRAAAYLADKVGTFLLYVTLFLLAAIVFPTRYYLGSLPIQRVICRVYYVFHDYPTPTKDSVYIRCKRCAHQKRVG